MPTQPNSTAEPNQPDPKVKGNIMITLAFVKDPSLKQDKVCIMLHNGIDPPVFLEAQSLLNLTPQYLLEQAIEYQNQLPVLRLDHSTQTIKARKQLQPVQSGIEPTPTATPTVAQRKLF